MSTKVLRHTKAVASVAGPKDQATSPMENAAEKEIKKLNQLVKDHETEERYLKATITRLEGDLERNRQLRQDLEDQRNQGRKEVDRIMEILRLVGNKGQDHDYPHPFRLDSRY